MLQGYKYNELSAKNYNNIDDFFAYDRRSALKKNNIAQNANKKLLNYKKVKNSTNINPSFFEIESDDDDFQISDDFSAPVSVPHINDFYSGNFPLDLDLNNVGNDGCTDFNPMHMMSPKYMYDNSNDDDLIIPTVVKKKLQQQNRKDSKQQASQTMATSFCLDNLPPLQEEIPNIKSHERLLKTSGKAKTPQPNKCSWNGSFKPVSFDECAVEMIPLPCETPSVLIIEYDIDETNRFIDSINEKYDKMFEDCVLKHRNDIQKLIAKQQQELKKFDQARGTLHALNASALGTQIEVYPEKGHLYTKIPNNKGCKLSMEEHKFYVQRNIIIQRHVDEIMSMNSNRKSDLSDIQTARSKALERPLAKLESLSNELKNRRKTLEPPKSNFQFDSNYLSVMQNPPGSITLKEIDNPCPHVF